MTDRETLQPDDGEPPSLRSWEETTYLQRDDDKDYLKLLDQYRLQQTEADKETDEHAVLQSRLSRIAVEEIYFNPRPPERIWTGPVKVITGAIKTIVKRRQ